MAVWNYLRVRGEYYSPREICGPALELPPRARRIPPPGSHAPIYMGTTSACAENTGAGMMVMVRWRNYLRVRGEYCKAYQSRLAMWELPPRARRIHPTRLSTGITGGTTSACAENTWSKNLLMRLIRNYLRVRGEYHQNPTLVDEIAELPPRARRIPGSYCPCYRTRRTTSACAENTPGGAEGLVRGWNYLRVRGEYPFTPWLANKPMELPPRARRIRHRRHAGRHRHGTTSACAENTAPKRHGARYPGNYLRVRGEYRHPRFRETINPELPPRARRILDEKVSAIQDKGTTSACAENTTVDHQPPG